jgi:hypothetical protein
MPVAVPLAIAGATIAGSAISSRASRDAARTQAASTDRAADLQNQQFQQLLRLAMPGYQRAEGAAGTYMQALGLSSGAAPSGFGGTGTVGTGGPTQPTPGQAGGPGGSMGRGVQQRQLFEAAPQMMTGGGPQVMPQPGNPQTQPQATGTAGGAGGAAGGQLNIAQQVMNTPGYRNQMAQGIKAIDRAAPLVGGMYSGRRMKALNDYGQQTFGSYYNDWLNRVGGMAGQAPQIAQNIGQAGIQNANNIGNLWMTGANARAQGTLNSASAWSGGLGNLAGMMGGYFG